MSNKYPYKELKLLSPSFDSSLIDLILELDILRNKPLGGTTPAEIFFQLKPIFHMLESLGSARIEGNQTSVEEFIRAKIEKKRKPGENIIEIRNGEKALLFIDRIVKKGFKFDENFIRELQKIVVQDLSPEKEGDDHPGEYRDTTVFITNSDHKPPAPIEVKYYMEELISFMNQEVPPKYDLLNIALTHHRFVWIHPFADGNGRTVRLITYAQLVSCGFNVNMGGGIINPTAVFCIDRSKYYEHLAGADLGIQEGLSDWCEYVFNGLKKEIQKIDKLTNYKFLTKKILIPAIAYSLEIKDINDMEASILRIAVEKKSFQANDLKPLFQGKDPAHISRYIRRMKDKDLLVSDPNHIRKYFISFSGKLLIRGVTKMLDENNFLPKLK